MDNLFQETIEGTHILLRKVGPGDAEAIYSWRSGLAGRYMRQPDNYSVDSQRNWIAARGNQEINYIIVDRKTKEDVGMVGIYDVNHADKIANVGRLLLSDEYLGKSTPYGLEALMLTYDYVFNHMHFRKISGDILGPNESMFKLQKYLGMAQEGYLKQHVFINGEYHDLYLMSLFKDQFNNGYKKKISFLLKSFKS